MRMFEILPRCGWADRDFRIGMCLLVAEEGHSYCENCRIQKSLGSLSYDAGLYDAYMKPAEAKRLYDILKSRMEELGKNKVYDAGCRRLWNKYME